ncbi:ferrochelatase 1 [Arenicella chitinivorans]|uniref:Ferrochelatase n=2 Tax=Arenicella chitinivorans TaxID=1329800 RepID=A0A918VMV5_9GAMM|nr:ferrochelatase 1 [Arenicella chitinivorans]
MDPRVIELPALFRTILVKGIIINFRAHKSAATYREIWTEEGSPLLINTQGLGDKTATLLGDEYQVEIAMRYGQPSVEEKLRKLHNAGTNNLIVIPLYPQYSGSTNGSTFDAVAKALQKFRWVPNLKFVSHYYDQPAYIQAIADSVKSHWDTFGRAQKLIMSFHGVPKKYITKGDPYQQQCQATALAIAKKLALKDDEWMLVFQSRFGAQEWLQPYCDETLKSLPAQGIKSVDMICPGFSADCLETLEEIEGENKEYFMKAGGEDYRYISCLNDSPAHAALMADIVHQHSQT